MSPLLSAANIGPTDTILLLNSNHTLTADVRVYLTDLFMEKPDILRVYVLLDAEAWHRFAERNSEVWRRFLDGLGMHGPEWSGNICRDGGVYGC